MQRNEVVRRMLRGELTPREAAEVLEVLDREERRPRWIPKSLWYWLYYHLFV